jgi:hypothetical protein
MVVLPGKDEEVLESLETMRPGRARRRSERYDEFLSSERESVQGETWIVSIANIPYSQAEPVMPC